MKRGLGVQELQVKKTSLLREWLFTHLTEGEVWQTLPKRRYIGFKKIRRFIGS
jgi:hypothetical protein